jgi:hypothetical protein
MFLSYQVRGDFPTAGSSWNLSRASAILTAGSSWNPSKITGFLTSGSSWNLNRTTVFLTVGYVGTLVEPQRVLQQAIFIPF